MAANPWRGEVDIWLGGKAYVMRPTFAALSAIEQTLGQGLIALAGKLAAGDVTLEEIAVIMSCCLADNVPEHKTLLVQGDMAGAVAAISRMFAIVFGGLDALSAG